MRIRRTLMSLAALLVAAATANAAQTFTATEGTRSASATFDVVGNNLVITLVNTSTEDALVPIDILTGLFFDDGDHTFGTVSAVLASGSTVSFGGTDPGGVVGGEWAFKGGLSGAPGTAGLGISSSGLGLFGPSDRFPGNDLQEPESPDGLQYGITTAGDNLATGNAAVTGANALIKNAVVFTLSMDAPYTLESLNIRNVSFQYGTALDEPNITTPDGGATVMLLGMALTGLSIVARRVRRLSA